MRNDGVSVIMPCLNCGPYIRQAMESVLKQDYDGLIELIVVDNGSEDDTVSQVLEQMPVWENIPNRRMQLYHIAEKGAAKSRNKGMQEATCTYTAFLDADDWWDTSKLSKQMDKFLKEPNCVLVCCGRELMKPNGESTGRTILVGKDRITFQDLLHQNAINCSSAVFRTAIGRQYQMIHDDSHEDYILWLRLLRDHGSAVVVDEPLLKTRLSEGGKSRNKLKSAWMTFKVYRYVGFSIPRSIACFCSYAWHGVKKYYL